MSEFVLPPGAYLGWRYVDARRGIDRVQLYHDDGRVELVEGGTRTELCRLSKELVAAAKVAISDSGLMSAENATAAGGSDTAAVTYAWRLGEDEGSLLNSGYPAVSVPAVERLDAVLAQIEEAAGCTPLMADDEAAAEFAAMDD